LRQALSLWTPDRDEPGNSIDRIARRIINMKTFTNKHIGKALEPTTIDLLRKCGTERKPPHRVRSGSLRSD
jgi:hypothetical protein